MISVPNNLDKEGLKYILLGKNQKIPLEQNWQKENNYTIEDPKLQEHLKKGFNYGVLCGGGLIVIDADTEKLNKIVKKEFPKTFTVKTSKGHHYYYSTVGFEQKKVLKDGNEHLGEIQNIGSFVVGANCVHPSGDIYKIVNDVDIERIESDLIQEKLGMYFSSERIGKEVIVNGSSSGLRNESMFKLACSFKYRRLSEEETYTALLGINQKNNPPLPDLEIKNIVSSAYNYKTDKSSGFILDSDEVWENKLFIFDKLNKNICYYGLLLPKKQDVYDKTDKDKLLYTTQIRSPALITSQHEIVSSNSRLQEDYKIRISTKPSELRLRWSLESIKSWINNQAQVKSFSDIYQMIFDQYDTYVSMQDIWKTIHAIWDIGTYFFPLFKVYPLFELRGMRGTGKTKTMGVSRLITLNATDIMINPSEATLFRETNDKRPTKYIDEAENLFRFNRGKPEPDPRVEVINSSYRFDGCVPRQEKIGSRYVTVYYHTYSPTMIGSINGLYGATEDRAIIRITTKPNKKDESKGNIEPELLDNVWQDIRNNLYILGLSSWEEIEKEYHKTKNETDLKNRDFWIWKPILIIAKMISKEIYDNVLKQAVRQQETKNADYIPDDSIEHEILEKMYLLLLNRTKVHIKDIRANLIQDSYTPKEKTISSKLDKIGFRDYRGKDRDGSYFKISKEDFESMILPICPSIFSSQSSQSSQEEVVIDDNKDNNNVMNGDECDEEPIPKCDECDECDECTNNSEVTEKNNILIFDKNCLVWQQCMFPDGKGNSCGNTPCNELDGLHYCEDHFKEVQKLNGGKK